MPATAAMTLTAMEVCKWAQCRWAFVTALAASSMQLHYAACWDSTDHTVILQAQESCHCCADEMAGSGASSDSAAASQDLAAAQHAAEGAAEASSGNSSDDSSDAEEASPGGYESEGVPLPARRRHLHPEYAGVSFSEAVAAGCSGCSSLHFANPCTSTLCVHLQSVSRWTGGGCRTFQKTTLIAGRTTRTWKI